MTTIERDTRRSAFGVLTRRATFLFVSLLLLLAAALASSLSAIVKRFRFGFSHETARQAVHANLPALDALVSVAERADRLLGRSGPAHLLLGLA